jgi:adenylylsulfate kinase-like enzyme
MIPLLWLCGPPGVGKTTVAWQIFSRLTRAGVATAYVDIDQLGICHPEPISDPGRHRMNVSNLSAVVANFRSAGAQCVVVSGVTDPNQGVIRDQLPGIVLTVCRLRADRDDLVRRFVSRSGDIGQLNDVIREADDLDRTSFAHACIDTTGLAVPDVTRLVLERTRWPILTGPSRLERRTGPTPPERRTGPTPPERRTGANVRPAIDADGPVLWLCGPTAVGKSTVGWQIFRTAVRDGLTAAYVDLEQIGFLRPTLDGIRHHRLKAGNLAALWQTYRAAGAECLIVVGSAENAAAVGAYRDALSSADMTLCRMHAGRDQLTRQIMLRGQGGSWAAPGDPLTGLPAERLLEIADDAAAEGDCLAQAAIGDFDVAVDGRTVEDLADAIRARTKGLAPA